MPFGIIRILVNLRQRKLQHMMIYSSDGTHENSLKWSDANFCLILHGLLLSLHLIGMHRNQGRWVTSRVKPSTAFNNICVLIMCVCVCPLPATSVRCLKESVCLSRTGWRWTLPPRRQTLGWLQVCLRFSINRYFLYSRIFIIVCVILLLLEEKQHIKYIAYCFAHLNLHSLYTLHSVIDYCTL